MHKALHGLILAAFAFSCLALWGILNLAPGAMPGLPLPAFTRFCIDLKPVLAVLPIFAALYCGYVWFSKTGATRSWVGFSAGTTMALVLVMLPTLLACWLPMIAGMNRLSTKSP